VAEAGEATSARPKTYNLFSRVVTFLPTVALEELHFPFGAHEPRRGGTSEARATPDSESFDRTSETLVCQPEEFR